MKINLGGTCGNSNWRDILIPMLRKEIFYRNPLLSKGEWKYNEEEKKNKLEILKTCDYLLYVITPEQKGFCSIASVVDYSNKEPHKVIFCVLNDFNGQKFDKHQLESLNYVKDIVRNNGGIIFDNLEQIATYLNQRCSIKGGKNEINSRIR